MKTIGLVIKETPKKVKETPKKTNKPEKVDEVVKDKPLQ